MRRGLVLSLILTSTAAAASLPLVAVGGPGDKEYPDLRADPPSNPVLQRYTGSPDRLLIRFDGYVTNVGDGPLDVEGNPSSGQMTQRVRQGLGLVDERSVPVVFQRDDGHNHWHLMEVMRYSLRSGTSATSPLAAPGQKTGFCLVDSEHAPQPRPTPSARVYSTTADFNQGFCGAGKPELTSLRMGVSVGWRDVYNRDLAFQWVDVSATAPGSYHLAAEADPNGIITESVEANPPAFRTTPVTVPGHMATAVGPVDTGFGTATPVTLRATTVGSPGTRAFRITSAPANGALNVAVGATVTGDSVVYTPRPGFTGTDTFRFAAVTTTGATEGFPRTPSEATATVRVGGAPAAPRVGLSGAPASLVAGTSAQLQAVVTDAGPGVRWSVTAGTISPAGLFTAPSAPPPGGAVTVRATSTDAPAASAEAAIAILPAPDPRPAPLTPGSGPLVPATPGGTVTGAPGPAAGPRMLSRPALKRAGRVLVVRVTPGRRGRVAIAAIRGGTVAAACAKPSRAGRRVDCALTLPARLTGRPVRVVVGLRAAGDRYAVRALSRR